MTLTNILKISVAALVLHQTTLAEISFTPIHFRQVSGVRPFIDVLMNGKSFRLMVHSNASFYVMTNHANAEAIGVPNLRKSSNYGIDSDGHVSDLGKAVSVLKSLRIAKRTQNDVAIDVFETPVSDMQGMLGIAWLRQQRVIVDYDKYQVGIPETPGDSQEEDRQLLSRGFRKLKMKWDERLGRYFVTGAVNGVPGRFLVSTVSSNILEPTFAKSAGVEIGALIGEGHGPTGTNVDQFLAKREIRLTIEGLAAACAQPDIMDSYAYQGLKPPANPSERVDGTLGTDFMLANQAVINFGTESLFIKD